MFSRRSVGYLVLIVLTVYCVQIAKDLRVFSDLDIDVGSEEIQSSSATKLDVNEAIQALTEKPKQQKKNIVVELKGNATNGHSCKPNLSKVNVLDKQWNNQSIMLFESVDEFVIEYDVLHRDGARNKTFHNGIHLFTTWFDNKEDSRRSNEIKKVIVTNLENAFIDYVHILFEEEDYSSLNQLARNHQEYQHKLILVRVKQQPTYAMYFLYLNKMLRPPAIAMISNGDIYFDDTLKCARPLLTAPALESAGLNVALALTRGNCSMDKYIGSHDTFIFLPPVPCSVISRVHHFQNRIGAENNVIYELQVYSKLRVLNPCTQIRSYHRHRVRSRRYGKAIGRNITETRPDMIRDSSGKIIEGDEKSTHGHSFVCNKQNICRDDVSKKHTLRKGRRARSFFFIDCVGQSFHPWSPSG